MKKLYLGTSGYVYKDWKGKFYPKDLHEKDWLSFYARKFNTVEINVSFYRTIKPEEYQNWFEQTPGKFIFAIKGHRYITQQKKLHDISDALVHVYNGPDKLQEKLSVMLWQFPKFFQYNATSLHRLQQFLQQLPKTNRHAFEFRHVSWFNDTIYGILQQYNACLVFGESSVYPLAEEITADFVYIRFHGPEKLYGGSYLDEELKIWADKIERYRGIYDTYVYFNNDVNGYAVENARTLRSFLER